ncbi:hypothetical protein, unlikely [Trypanosoma brucei gambiense DAL972]|uniref:Uncharacterized protein n=1 Tax=Trypanosoma brucei gambiense (strain MHOM/CI/86/DAL972) TaxID=679716 RepID=D0A337_TRYB9|nr:hypothetical protein, unlikely [Trypanosoma brucei gambiense DAL972]CBH15681.1 hypothetical protein, unlikely [Trypanosoma brucei gambiense DAL972]|eukprot:XP_011777945.1 hypothetical protein, unlikely [Trypanosoma brucei gambiense DAL972]
MVQLYFECKKKFCQSPIGSDMHRCVGTCAPFLFFLFFTCQIYIYIYIIYVSRSYWFVATLSYFFDKPAITCECHRVVRVDHLLKEEKKKKIVHSSVSRQGIGEV